MPLKKLVLILVCAILTLGWVGSVQAQYLLTGNSGGEMQIGTGLPLPIGPNGIFAGGKAPGTAGKAYWPDLLVPPNPNVLFGASPAPTATIMQNLSTTMGGAIAFPPGVLTKPAAGSPVRIGVFPTNPALMQVATSVDYSWPSVSQTFAPGGAPGPAVLGTGIVNGVIAYSGGAKSFGGPGQFSFTPGPGASGGRVPTNPGGVDPIATVWINAFAGLPATVMTVAVAGASNMGGLAQPGAPVTGPVSTTAFGPITTMGFGGVNITTGGTAMNPFCCTVGPLGTINASVAAGGPGLTNMVTGSKGFPWTTGFITVSQPNAVPPEIFFLSGTDMRVSGIGNVSLVSGSLSVRKLSGPNANRGWLSLTLVTPEPSAVLAAAGALGMLGLCHTLVRRRSR